MTDMLILKVKSECPWGSRVQARRNEVTRRFNVVDVEILRIGNPGKAEQSVTIYYISSSALLTSYSYLLYLLYLLYDCCSRANVDQTRLLLSGLSHGTRLSEDEVPNLLNPAV